MQSVFTATCIVVAGVLSIARPAFPLTITVDQYAQDGQSPSDCSDVDVGDCSLREAVLLANATPGADVITLAAATATLTIPRTTPDDASSGDLDITEAVTIEGASGGGSKIDAGEAPSMTDRIFHVHALAGQLILRDVALERGSATGETGGAILIEGGGSARLERSSIAHSSAQHGGAAAVAASGTLQLVDGTVITENEAQLGGGGIQVAGTLTLEDATIAANTGGYGGGIEAAAASSVSLTRSTIDFNVAQNLFWGANGGGILARSYANVTLVNSTISSNRALHSGGGLYAAGPYGWFPAATITLSNSTVAFNVANTNGNGGSGGGLYQAAATGFVVRNTIVSDNRTGTAADDCAGNVVSSQGHNLFEESACVSTPATGDLVGVDPVLEPHLRPNGQGWSIQPKTRTHGLIAGTGGSPAINAGDATSCATTDQRGVTRAGLGSACDIGAFEADACGNGTVRDPEVCEPASGPATCTARCENHEVVRLYAAKDTMIPEAHKMNNDGGWGYGWIKVSQGAHNYGLIGFDTRGLFTDDRYETLAPSWDIVKATMKLRVAQNHFTRAGTTFDVYAWRTEATNPQPDGWTEGQNRFDLFSYCSQQDWARPAGNNDTQFNLANPAGATWSCSEDADTEDGDTACDDPDRAWDVEPVNGVHDGFGLPGVTTTRTTFFTAADRYENGADVLQHCSAIKESIRNECEPTCGNSIACFRDSSNPPVPSDPSIELADYCFRTITIDLTESLRHFVAAGVDDPSWLIRRQTNSGPGAFHYFSREGAVCILGECGAATLSAQGPFGSNRTGEDVKQLMPLIDVELKRTPPGTVEEPEVTCHLSYDGRCPAP